MITNKLVGRSVVYLLVVMSMLVVGLIVANSSAIIPKGPPDPTKICQFHGKLYSEGFVREEKSDYLRCHNTQWVPLESTSQQ